MSTALDPDSRAGLARNTGSPRQFASVRKMVLQDGWENGLEALNFSTGAGLQFWAFPGRCLDIGPLWFEGQPVHWEHPAGYASTALFDPESDGGTGIERGLSGFLVTCGIENTRGSRGKNPQHGRLPGTPARLISAGEAWEWKTPTLFASGEAVSAHLRGPCYRLQRSLTAPIGENSVTITDRVENIGVEPLPLHILYHFNLGHPFLSSASRLHVGDQRRPIDEDNKERVRCYRLSNGSTSDGRLAEITGGHAGKTTLRITGDPNALPYLQTWRDPRPRRNVLSVEPTNTTRNADGSSQEGQVLAPGETWFSALTVRFFSADRPASV